MFLFSFFFLRKNWCMVDVEAFVYSVELLQIYINDNNVRKEERCNLVLEMSGCCIHKDSYPWISKSAQLMKSLLQIIESNVFKLIAPRLIVSISQSYGNFIFRQINFFCSTRHILITFTHILFNPRYAPYISL